MSAETDLQAVVAGLEASVAKLATAVTNLPNADAVPAATVEAAVASLDALGTQLDAIVAAITPAPAEAIPTVTGVSPSTGSVGGGEAISISGTGFTGATNVNFGGTRPGSRSIPTRPSRPWPPLPLPVLGPSTSS